MTFVPLGMDRTLFQALLPFRAADDGSVVVRKANPRPLRQDDIWRRLQWRGWLQWLKTTPVAPGNERTARLIDVLLRITPAGLNEMNAYELAGGDGVGLPDGWFWIVDENGSLILGDADAMAGQ